jgi:carboxyl-terminal processing protease
MEAMSKDATLKEKRERWHEQLAKDIYVEEALNVLEDLQSKKVIKKPITPKLKPNPLVKS